MKKIISLFLVFACLFSSIPFPAIASINEADYLTSENVIEENAETSLPADLIVNDADEFSILSDADITENADVAEDVDINAADEIAETLFSIKISPNIVEGLAANVIISAVESETIPADKKKLLQFKLAVQFTRL